MPKRLSQKRWNATHKDKIKEYNAKYFSDKTKVTITLDNATIDAVHRLKSDDISLTEKLRAIIKDWVNEKQRGI